MPDEKKKIERNWDHISAPWRQKLRNFYSMPSSPSPSLFRRKPNFFPHALTFREKFHCALILSLWLLHSHWIATFHMRSFKGTFPHKPNSPHAVRFPPLKIHCQCGFLSTLYTYPHREKNYSGFCAAPNSDFGIWIADVSSVLDQKSPPPISFSVLIY